LGIRIRLKHEDLLKEQNQHLSASKETGLNFMPVNICVTTKKDMSTIQRNSHGLPFVCQSINLPRPIFASPPKHCMAVRDSFLYSFGFA
jgi:hypothetical protein